MRPHLRLASKSATQQVPRMLMRTLHISKGIRHEVTSTNYNRSSVGTSPERTRANLVGGLLRLLADARSMGVGQASETERGSLASANTPRIRHRIGVDLSHVRRPCCASITTKPPGRRRRDRDFFFVHKAPQHEDPHSGQHHFILRHEAIPSRSRPSFQATETRRPHRCRRRRCRSPVAHPSTRSRRARSAPPAPRASSPHPLRHSHRGYLPAPPRSARWEMAQETAIPNSCERATRRCRFRRAGQVLCDGAPC